MTIKLYIRPHQNRYHKTCSWRHSNNVQPPNHFGTKQTITQLLIRIHILSPARILAILTNQPGFVSAYPSPARPGNLVYNTRDELESTTIINCSRTHHGDSALRTPTSSCKPVAHTVEFWREPTSSASLVNSSSHAPPEKSSDPNV
jgi:hypothetical protein